MSPQSPLLQAEHLFWSRHDEPIIQDLSLRLQPGEVLGIIGPNGAGKSTLLRLLAGLIPPQHGERRLLDTAYGNWDPSAFARTLAYQEQDARIHWPLTVERVVSLGRLPWQKPFAGHNAEDQAAIDQALATCALSDFRQRPADQLSAGERARVSLARLLAGQPRVLLADEPAAAMDLHHQWRLMETLQHVTRNAQGRGVILVLHDLNLAARFCDRLLLLHQGRAITEGPPREVLTAHTLKQYYHIEAAIMDGPQGLMITPLRRL